MERQIMGRQMYFYYLEWLFVYNQNRADYLQINNRQFYLKKTIKILFTINSLKKKKKKLFIQKHDLQFLSI